MTLRFDSSHKSNFQVPRITRVITAFVEFDTLSLIHPFVAKSLAAVGVKEFVRRRKTTVNSFVWSIRESDFLWGYPT